MFHCFDDASYVDALWRVDSGSAATSMSIMHRYMHCQTPRPSWPPATSRQRCAAIKSTENSPVTSVVDDITLLFKTLAGRHMTVYKSRTSLTGHLTRSLWSSVGLRDGMFRCEARLWSAGHCRSQMVSDYFYLRYSHLLAALPFAYLFI